MSGRWSRDGGPGAFPWVRPGGRGTGFVVHALAALAALAALHALVIDYVPFSIQKIGSSYLVFFYHFPAALNVFVFYGGVLAASIFYLATREATWDLRARAACEVGLVANAVLLVTGSCWAKAAWNRWWVWDDPRLMSAAIMSLTYLGYAVLQRGVEDPARRRPYAAVYGVLAFVNIPVVHYAIRWLGEVSHPMRFDGLSDAPIVSTRWYGVAAFLVFYLLVYRWRHDSEALRERAAESLERVRLLEERRGAR